MIGHAIFEPQSKRRDLGAVDIHAGRPFHARATHAMLSQERNHRRFEYAHKTTHPKPSRTDVNQRVEHRLSGPVIGHLTAAIAGHYRDLAGGQHMLGLAAQALGEHRRMGAGNESFRTGIPRLAHVGLHARERVLIFDASKRLAGRTGNPRRHACYSAMMTRSWPDRSV